MTNKEIISSLRGLIGKYNLTDEEWQTIEKTIKVLNNSDEDCISRAEAIKAVREAYSIYIPRMNGWEKGLPLKIDKAIYDLPSIQPKPKTGHWIAQDIYNCHTDFKCSECGYIHNFMHLYGKPTADYTYCPNCGAKMESEDKE